MATERYFFKYAKGTVMFGRTPTVAEPKPPAITVDYHNHFATVDDEAVQKLMKAHPHYGMKFWLAEDGQKAKPATTYVDGQATIATESGAKKDETRPTAIKR